MLDGGLVMTSGDFDILQDASTVLVVNDADSTLTTVDPARVSMTDSAIIPHGAEVALGGQRPRRSSIRSHHDPCRRRGQCWNRPAANGDPISGYELRILRGGSVVETLAASSTSQAVTVSTSESGYTFQIRALNKAGWGGWSGER